MGVDFRRADILMSQQCLDEAQVGTSLQKCCGKRVAQGMGRDGLLNAGSLGLSLDHNQDHHPCQVLPVAVQEDVVLLTGLDGHVAPVVKPVLQFLDGFLRDGYQPLL